MKPLKWRFEMERKIYNINQGVIEVYQFDPNMKELKRFRLQELDKLPVEEQILKREPTRSWFTPKKGVVYECENYILRRYDNPRVSKKDHVDLVREAILMVCFNNIEQLYMINYLL